MYVRLCCLQRLWCTDTAEKRGFCESAHARDSRLQAYVVILKMGILPGLCVCFGKFKKTKKVNIVAEM